VILLEKDLGIFVDTMSVHLDEVLVLLGELSIGTEDASTIVTLLQSVSIVTVVALLAVLQTGLKTHDSIDLGIFPHFLIMGQVFTQTFLGDQTHFDYQNLCNYNQIGTSV
jgi:hypothetical protein